HLARRRHGVAGRGARDVRRAAGLPAFDGVLVEGRTARRHRRARGAQRGGAGGRDRARGGRGGGAGGRVRIGGVGGRWVGTADARARTAAGGGPARTARRPRRLVDAFAHGRSDGRRDDGLRRTPGGRA